MTTPTPHPFAHVLEPLARDKDTKFQLFLDGSWIDMAESALLHHIIYENYKPERFRVKPATIMVGQREVPKPSKLAKKYRFYVGVNEYWFDTQEDADSCIAALFALLEGRP